MNPGKAAEGAHGPRSVPEFAIRAAVLTLSDRCHRGETVDTAGPAVAGLLASALETPRPPVEILPDDRARLARRLVQLCDESRVNLVVAVGGTGFAPRDVTPEAVRDVVERLTPGLDERMRAESLQKTPRAMLSRCCSGIRGQTLILSLPGSERSAVENLAAVLPALRHGIEKLMGDTADCGPPRGESGAAGGAMPTHGVQGRPFVLGICGYSGSGKTTLIEAVVPIFRKRGLRTLVVKHDAHAPSVDREGKDSHRFFQAGADVVLRSADETFFRRHGDGGGLPELLADKAAEYDIILVEGHKESPLPAKIWLRGDDEGEAPASAGPMQCSLGRTEDRPARLLSLYASFLGAATPESIPLADRADSSPIAEPRHKHG